MTEHKRDMAEMLRGSVPLTGLHGFGVYLMCACVCLFSMAAILLSCFSELWVSAPRVPLPPPVRSTSVVFSLLSRLHGY